LTPRARPLALLALLLSLLGCASPLATRTPDHEPRRATEARVKAALFESLGTAAAAIGVRAEAGAVTLTGFTATATERDRAVAAARGALAGERVRNEIRLK
jgi:osmotically-inducible protein OsmY